MNILNTDVPREDKSAQEKENFYPKVEGMVRVCLRKDNRRLQYMRTIGKHSLRKESNVVRLTHLAAFLNSHRCFEHKNIHKVTWKSRIVKQPITY